MCGEKNDDRDAHYKAGDLVGNGSGHWTPLGGSSTRLVSARLAAEDARRVCKLCAIPIRSHIAAVVYERATAAEPCVHPHAELRMRELRTAHHSRDQLSPPNPNALCPIVPHSSNYH